MKIQEFWAPVVFQAAASNADFITRYDFDGDYIGNNNWENFDKFPKPAYVYYDVKETKSHWFIFYSFFHPRDYISDPACQSSCHENDLESVQLTVRKDGTRYGKLEILETLAHDNIFLYTNDKKIKGGKLKVSGPISLLKGKPAVYIEQYGHGIYGGKSDSINANPMAMKVVQYIYKEKAEEPNGIPAKNIGYELLPIHETLWQYRDCAGDGKCYDVSFNYRGITLQSVFDGDTFVTDAANVPWGYNQAVGDDIIQGDWFLDPARAVLYHAGPMPDFSADYYFNPYIDDLKKMKK
ncbi:MAG: hypothetical protein WCX65_13760 [bacterium]